MPRILLAERDLIRGLIDTDGADQGPPHRSELLRVQRIACHGSGFALSDRRAIGKAIARRRGSFRALRPEAQSAHRLSPGFAPAAALWRPAHLKTGRSAGRRFEKSFAR